MNRHAANPRLGVSLTNQVFSLIGSSGPREPLLTVFVPRTTLSNPTTDEALGALGTLTVVGGHVDSEGDNAWGMGKEHPWTMAQGNVMSAIWN